MKTDFIAGDHTILYVTHGSHAYGTNIEGSDTDYKGICVPPARYFTGFAHAFEQSENKDPDSVIYDVRKFFRLAAACNPNIIEVLFTDDRFIHTQTNEGRILREHASAFLSKKARHTFSGYAVAQLKRIKTHRRWLLDPPKAPPNREDYGIPVHGKAIAPDAMGAIDKLVLEGHSFSGALMTAIDAEKRYATALQGWKQYQGWKASRNPARAETERLYGYDTKHGMHLVRLMRMCREILEGKGVNVYREDREELIAIRRGAWEYDRLIEWADKEDQEMERLYHASTLPHSPDTDRLDALCQGIVLSAAFQ